LEGRAGVSAKTVRKLETDTAGSGVSIRTYAKLTRCFHAHGLQFFDDSDGTFGVRVAATQAASDL